MLEKQALASPSVCTISVNIRQYVTSLQRPSATTEVSDKAVSKWENGNAKPRIATCCRLADILGVSLDELLSAAGYTQKSQMELPDEDVEAVLMQEEKRITERHQEEKKMSKWTNCHRRKHSA